MTEKIMYIVIVYLVVAFALGVLLGKMIKHNNPCRHDWKPKGYGGAGWSMYICRHCGERRIESE